MMRTPLSLQTKLVVMLYSLLVTMLLILYRAHMMMMFTTVVDPLGDMPAEEDRSLVSSSSSFHRSNNVGQLDAVLFDAGQPQQRRQHRCAINLYGLPRSFKHHVLPSFITNVVRVNRHYHCDYFVHYYNKTFESGGRSGRGGQIYPEDVLLLKPAIEDVYNNHSSSRRRHGQSPITVQFIGDTDEDFEREQMEHLQTIFEYNASGTNQSSMDNITTINPYFITHPKEKTMHGKQVLINILKMWHSQTKVWQLMEKYAAIAVHNDTHQHGQEHQQPFYSRVAMFRLDVVYITPIDIYRVPNEPAAQQGTKSRWIPTNNITDYYFYDVQNCHAVIPAFASFPVNDRMIYGPYAAVKIWAAERWERYQHHVFTVLPTYKSEAGAGLHDERMIKYSIIPAIRNEVDVEVMEDRSLYFLRVRANGNIWMEDSSKGTNDERKIVKTKLELSLQRNCGDPFQIKPSDRQYKIICPP